MSAEPGADTYASGVRARDLRVTTDNGARSFVPRRAIAIPNAVNRVARADSATQAHSGTDAGSHSGTDAGSHSGTDAGSHSGTDARATDVKLR